ncbi:MAG: DUF1311 domain-containing protein [Rhizobiales bacterium]|nr:lysozyme inhibitor LprI family protein [Hyphomicrobiales bacterium]NRB15367.1 DUF1311 domain-containing protein [Hyphomicrobiales bacterium]
MIKLLLKASLAGLFLVFGLANGHAADEPQVNCADPTNQYEMNYCAKLAYEYADEDLNFDYSNARTAMIEIDTYLQPELFGAKQALLDAQRAWIKYRDLACSAEGFLVRGGSMEGLIVGNCLERLTRQRSEDLRRIFEMN